MADELDFLDDEEEQDDEFEADDEFEDDDEFDDDFDDEFEDDFGDDDEFAAFGPVFVQGDVSHGFELIAVVFGFAAAAFALFLLWTQIGAPVYDNLLGEEDLQEYNGLGEPLAGGGSALSFAPRSVRVIGLGKYDPDSDGYDYAMLDAGADHGLGVGMLLQLDDATLAIVKVERTNARADFVDVVDTTQEISVGDSWMTPIDYRELANVPRAEETTVDDLLEVAATETPPAPPVSLPLHRNIVYEASDGEGRYSRYDLNPQLRLLTEAQFPSSEANSLDGQAQQEGGDFGYRVFTSRVEAEVRDAENQTLIRPLLEGARAAR